MQQTITMDARVEGFLEVIKRGGTQLGRGEKLEWHLERKKARRASKKVEIFGEKKNWDKKEELGLRKTTSKSEMGGKGKSGSKKLSEGWKG